MTGVFLVLALAQSPGSTPDSAVAPWPADTETIHRSVTCACVPFLSTNMAESPRVHTNCSFGCLGTFNASLSGFELSSGLNIETHDAEGMQLAGAINMAGGRFRGLQTTFGVNVAVDGVRGVQAALGINAAGAEVGGVQAAFGLNAAGAAVRGIQAAYAANFARGDVTGIQGAWVNAALGSVTGLQAAPGCNVCMGDVRGLQAGALNVAGRLGGCQVGLLNLGGAVRGAQVGVVNLARRMQGEPVGLVSVSGNSHATLNGWVDETAQLSIGLGTEVGHVYNLYYAGAAPTLRPAQAAAGIGLGTQFPFDEWVGMADVLLSARYAAGENAGFDGFVTRLRLLGGWRMGPGVLAFAGPTVSFALSGYGRATHDPAFGIPILRDETGPVTGWLGFTYGMRLFSP